MIKKKNKKMKILSAIIGTSAIAGGISVAAVAQSCNTTSEINTGERRTNALAAFRALNGTSTQPNDAGQLAFYNGIIAAISTVGNAVPVVSQITIADADTNVTISDDGLILSVTMNSITVTIDDQSSTTVSNTAGVLIVPVDYNGNDVFQTGRITGFVSADQATGLSALISLSDSNGRIPDSGTSERIIFDSIRNAIFDIDPSTMLFSIEISNPTETVSASIFGTTLTVEANSVVVISTGGNSSTYANIDRDLVISNVVYSSGTIISASDATGLSVLRT